MSQRRRLAGFRLSAVLAVLTIGAGCGSIVPQAPAHRWHVLQDLAPKPAGPSTPIPRTVLVESAASGAFVDAVALAYSVRPGQRSHYQYSGWTERPSARLARLVERRLASRGSFASVAGATSGLRGDLLLRITLDDAFHDLSTEPSAAELAMTVELLDWKRRMLLGRREFRTRIDVDRQDAATAAAGFSQAATASVDRIVDWVESLGAASR